MVANVASNENQLPLQSVLPIPVENYNTKGKDLDCKSPLQKLIQWTGCRKLLISQPSVGQQFQLLFTLLQIFGCSPVQVGHPNASTIARKKCVFRLFSAKSAFPFCSAVYFIFLWIKYLVELGFKQSFFGNSLKMSREYFTNFTSHFRNSQSMHGSTLGTIVTMDNVATFILVVIPLERIIAIIFSWTHASKMAEFLNSWDDLELRYQELCFESDRCHISSPEQLQREPLINLVSWRNTFLFRYVLIPGVIVFPFYFYANLNGSYKLDFLDCFISSTLSLQFVVCCLLQNASCVFTYKTVSEAFYKVKLRMAVLIRSERINPKILYSWRLYIHSLRGQCKLAGDLQMHQQLVQLGGTLIIITVMIFIVLDGDHDNSNSVSVTLVSIGYAFDLLIQLYTKTSTADQVTQNEKEIAETTLFLQTHLVDAAIYREAKFIHDMILMNPAKISLGNYVDLNKKLLLVASSQVATYIIVLMQLSHH